MNLAGLLPKGTNDAALSMRLQKVGLDVPPLTRYAIQAAPPGLLFGLAAFNNQEIRKGVERMVSVFSKE
jgi:DNA-binding transcriptional MocR family regulator